MQLQDGRLIVSATDLVGFLECDHLVTLELDAAAGRGPKKPIRDDPELELIRRRGYEHERGYLERLRDEGRTVTEITRQDVRTIADLEAAQAETVAAMRAGADVIFQATFFDGRWRGHADFLVRRDDRPSDLGPWSYDVADTKLARRVKAAAILQMCVYADLLEGLQGLAPETIAVVTGDKETHPHRLADYAAYYRAAKGRFEARVEAAERGFESADGGIDGDGSIDGDPAAPPTYPEPVDHCRVCSWWPICIDRRRADDHLSLVAGLRRSHRQRLVEAGTETLAGLARLEPEPQVRGIPPRIAERLRRQAALQLDRRLTGRLTYELLAPREDDPGSGLAALPEPAPLDVFFDIEADPWALEDGLEYLFGWSEVDASGADRYHAIWAHDRASEKAAFEQFVDLVTERLARDPGMHVYHYGGYESGALKRLMQRHATRDDEVDRLLRGKILVNLYDHVVRSAILASVESYSIKQIEKFYLPAREGPITEAGFSVVQYERWLETRDEVILRDLADYNRDDCVSTRGLRDWLEGLRVEASPLYPGGVVPRPSAPDPEPPADLAAAQAATRAREAALRAGVPEDRAARTEDEQARWLLAALLDWHRREAKPQWWLWFTLRDAPMEDLVTSGEALGELRREEIVGSMARSSVIRYRFDPAQETKLKEGDTPTARFADPAAGTSGGGTIIALDPAAGTIDLKRKASSPDPVGLIPGQPFNTAVMRDNLGRLADHVIADGLDGPGPYRAGRDLVARRPPRIRGLAPREPLAQPGESPSEAARRLVMRLDGTVLPIQGPPGTGKTWTGARMILDLVADRRRVGVTAQSHKVIANLLEATARAATEAGRDVRIAQKCDAGEGPTDDRIARLNDNAAVLAGLADRTFEVIGGTAWLWSRPEMAGIVDVLFVDEAGQLSLANACAVAAAADSVVLLGDPNQLPQVSQGVQPEGAGASALEHLVGDAATIAPDRGLLLDTTYRLHPDVNAYVSDAFYEGRLRTDPKNARQVLAPGEVLGGTGVRHVAIEHVGAGNRSPEEARWIAAAIDALVGRPWVDRHGVSRPLDVADILVVAPYNAQVAEIDRAVRARLGVGPNVGTVDKFQGREAPVAIYSMATSTPDDAPRDFDFLYSGNRLNVAISRARSLAVLVAAPALLRVACHTPEQMRLVNVLCRLLEVAAEQSGHESRPGGRPPSASKRLAGEPELDVPPGDSRSREVVRLDLGLS